MTSYETQLTKINNTYAPMIENQLKVNGINMTDYQRQVVISALSAINNMLTERGESITKFDQNNVTQILLTVASLQLNADATPREVYFIVRNHKQGAGMNAPKVPQIELGIEGDGNDAMLARFGRDVERVYPFWQVRENDQFAYPQHKGIELTPPEWTETGIGKVAKVVYPIEFKDGNVHYYIAEREGVKKNLLAHVANNLMWDKSGAKDKFMANAEELTLDQILNDEELVKQGQISPAWSSPQSRETMIVRKMRNNIVKKIPKDFSNKFLEIQYEDNTNDSLKRMRKDITENAGQIDLDPIHETQAIEPTHVEKSTKEILKPKKEKAIKKEEPIKEPEPVEPYQPQELTDEEIEDAF